MNYGYGPQEMDTAQNLVVRAGRRADPPIHDAYAGIHCLMTHKDEVLYTAVVLKIQELLPQLQPTSMISDWERSSRNAFKHI